MHDENSVNGLERLPNGRIRKEYEAECHKFLERFYPSLYKYALHQVKGNHDTAQDLLHDTIVVLLEGRDKINFITPPLTYMQLMISRQRVQHRQSKRKNFNNNFIYGAEGFTKISGGNPREDTLDGIVHIILKQLSPRHRYLMECLLDGGKVKAIAKEFDLTAVRIYQIRANAFSEFRELLAAQFPDVTLDDLGLR